MKSLIFVGHEMSYVS